MVSFTTTLAWITIIAVANAYPKIRHIPLSDSITDYDCWRAWVDQNLDEDGLDGDVDFVGSGQLNTPCDNLDYDRDHEGHPGFQATDIARDNLFVDWLRANPADIITMHLGTVDIMRSGRAPADTLDAYTTLVQQMRDSNAHMKIVGAQIIPYPADDALVKMLNQQIPAWADGMNKTDSPIWVVDQWSGFDGGVNLYDGIHPRESGDMRISTRFYPAIWLAIGSVVRDKLARREEAP